MGLSRRPGGPLPWRLALETLTLTVCLGVCVQPASAQGAAAGVINATVGDTVTLTAPAVTVTILTSSWYRGIGVAASQIICTYFASPPRQVNGLQYTGRETCQSDGSLQIRDLLTNYTGNYTVNVQPNSESAVEASRQLMVYENVSIPVIQAVPQNPVENGSLVLVCNASGTDISYQWYQDDRLITSGGRINITHNSQTLTLSPCTRNDTGTSFTCGASNAVSHSTSSQYTLTVSFAEPVTKPTVTSVPSQLVENRGPAEITCNASKAATTILWSFNKSPDLPGIILPYPDNRTLTIANVSRRDSGTYQCVAMNPVSSSTSDPLALTVAYGPEDVKIDPPGSHSVQNGTKLSLSCTAKSFPDPRYQWLLNGTELKSTAGTYTDEKVSSRDSGNYTCVAENTVTGLTAKTSVSVDVTGTDLPPMGSPCPTPCSCWQTTLGVACGVLLGAAIIVAVMAVHYERRLKQDTTKDENVYQNPEVIKNDDTQYENVKKGHAGQSANPDSAADPAYMALKHGDRATYEQIKRP